MTFSTCTFVFFCHARQTFSLATVVALLKNKLLTVLALSVVTCGMQEVMLLSEELLYTRIYNEQVRHSLPFLYYVRLHACIVDSEVTN